MAISDSSSVGSTSSSLLERVRDPNDQTAWQRFSSLYTPLLYSWLGQHHGIQDQDADDLVAEVLAVLVRELPQFHYDRAKGAFRAWLRTILAHRILNFLRGQRSQPAVTCDSDLQNILAQLEDPRSDLAQQFDRQHNQHIAHRLLELIEADFARTTWAAFRRLVLDGEKPDAVAAALGITVAAAYGSKYRVLARLREEIKGLLD